MAELATIARPYAEALFKATVDADAASISGQIGRLAEIVADPQLRRLADDPNIEGARVYEVVVSVASDFGEVTRNLLRTVIENRRLAVLPEIAAQFHALVGERTGVSDAIVYSAYPLDPQQESDLRTVLEKRFGRKLTVKTVEEPALIGGVRVVVGDEVLDTSIKARLEQMKTALTAA